MKLVIAFLLMATTLILPAGAFAVSEHIEYNINILTDGSATWTIIQVTDIDSTVDNWEEYEQRLISATNNANNNTPRDIELDFASLEMGTQIHWETSSKTITQIFRWQNFSIVEHGQISFGDVFTEGFFSFLYGDGEVYISYPADFQLRSATYEPNQIDDSTQTLHWYRTQDFLAGTQNILLEAKNSSSNSFLDLFATAAIGSGGLAITAIGFVILIQRRVHKDNKSELEKIPTLQEVESDQDKVLQLLESSGGNLKQSEVCNKLRFSRAKTSLLLAEMEKNSLVKRIKKGKTKIVYRSESREGQKY